MTLHKSKPDQLIYVKGSTEAILKRCAQRLNTEGLGPLDRTQVEQRCNGRAGLRVLAFAKKPVATSTHWIILILIRVWFPRAARDDRSAASGSDQGCACLSAGIQVKMITGDHALTAGAIARMMVNQTDEVRPSLGGSAEQSGTPQAAEAGVVLPGRTGTETAPGRSPAI